MSQPCSKKNGIFGCMFCAVFLWLTWGSSAIAVTSAAQGSNLGKRQKDRTYLLGDRPFSPIEIIENDAKVKSPKSNGTLRDPGYDPRAKLTLPPKLSPKIAEKPKIKKVQPKIARLNFKKMRVKGFKRDPRVDFSQENLPIPRSDESLPVDFSVRTFEEERGL